MFYKVLHTSIHLLWYNSSLIKLILQKYANQAIWILVGGNFGMNSDSFSILFPNFLKKNRKIIPQVIMITVVLH